MVPDFTIWRADFKNFVLLYIMVPKVVYAQVASGFLINISAKYGWILTQYGSFGSSHKSSFSENVPHLVPGRLNPKSARRADSGFNAARRADSGFNAARRADSDDDFSELSNDPY